MEKIERLPLRPFTRFCMSIGAVPSAYLAGLTIEEQLLWLCSYLEKEVIPAVNNNAEAVEELQNLYIELKNYVDTYFDNLDVQEKINNKLDEMAESGQLTDIIAQYLQLAGVLAYDTKTAMKTATNLTEGSITKTLGNTNYQDGQGAFYKVRQIQNTDIVDDENIIALNDPDLVAEKIPFSSGYDIANIEDFVLYAFFDDDNDDEIKFYVSKDNIHLQQIKTTNKIYGRDPSIIYYNNKFYIAVTNSSPTHDFVIYESDDLENWTTHYINANLYDETYPRRWAPDFFIDDNNDLYVFISKQYANTEGLGDFDIYKTKCTDINNLTFSNGEKVVLNGTTSTNHIDATCCKINGTYHLIVKDENQSGLTLEHYTSTDMEEFTLQNYNFADFGRYVEGQFVYKFKNEYIIGAEKYAESNIRSCYRIKKSNDFINFSNYENMFIKDVNLSHGDAFVIDDFKAKKIISKMSGFNFKYDYNFDINKKDNYLIAYATLNNETPKGRYLKLFSLTPKSAYKSGSIQFNICDGQRLYFDSNIELSYRILTLEPFNINKLRTDIIYANIEYNAVFKYGNLHGKIISIPNLTDKTIDVYFDLNDYNNDNIDLTIMLKFFSINEFNEDIKIYTDTYVNTLPTTVQSVINANYKSKSMTPALYNTNIDNGTRSNIRIKMCMRNGAFKVVGHGTGTNEQNSIDYQINTLNGSINAIKKITNGINLTFTVESYNDNIYSIIIAGIPNYSGLNIQLPNDLQSSILSVELY